MEIDSLGFACPHCGTRLMMPAGAYGLEGPCPRCGAAIQAPKLPAFAITRKVPIPIRLEVEEEPETARPLPSMIPAAEIPISKPLMKATNVQILLLGRVLASLVVLGLIGAGIGFIYVRQKNPDPSSGNSAARTRDEPIIFTDPAQETDTLPARTIPEVPAIPEGMDVDALTAEARGTMETFLSAKDLEQRLPLMETATPSGELEASFLAKPVEFIGLGKPQVRFNKMESAMDVHCLVQLKNVEGVYETHWIAVRKRAERPAKVLVDPLLDAFGGRIHDFAAKPQEGSRVFHPMMTVFDFCNSTEVPGAAQKCTVKLTGSVGGPDLAKAYFGKLAPLKGKLERMGLNYGKTTKVTLTLHWNTHHDAARPFLEVLDVQSLDWDQ